MKKIKPLPYQLLRTILNTSQLNFKTTNEIKGLAEFVGQKRALDALQFGIGVKSKGYNIYAMGPSGIGKLSLIQKILKDHAEKAPTPPDWCYIHNFEIPEKPVAVQLPAGQGIEFQKDMNYFIEKFGANIVALFDTEEFRLELKKIGKYYDGMQKRLKVNKRKKVAFGLAALIKEQCEKEKNLHSELTKTVIQPLIRKLKAKYKNLPVIKDYLTAVQKDIIEHVNELVRKEENNLFYFFSLENPLLMKYKVNLLVDNSQLKGAPIIFEEKPVYSNIVCRVEHILQMGALVTNFTLIRPGAMHKANGGYLIIEARKLKRNPETWEALKTALFAQKIKIDPIQNVADPVKTVSLEPEPIPLDIKVILLGDRNTYYYLSQNDPDFSELFKVPADFDEVISRDKKNIHSYAQLVANIIQREHLKVFNASAVAEIIDHSTRLAEDNEKLSTYLLDVEDLVVQSDYFAQIENKRIVDAKDVRRAIDAQIQRMDRTRELYFEDIQRNFIIVKTSGTALGQTNCLSVRRVGNFNYGHPTRVTARVRLNKGKDKFIDIQREIKLAGPLHSKAGLIITSFLVNRISPDKDWSVTASLAFEQVYCWTDGDSASVGELCALISALARVPIIQSLAVTGSIDQYGEVQAIGGVNEKIEGFYDICAGRGLTGEQGVLIPAVNQKNLMLREDIVASAKNNKFFIYPISTVEEAIFLLTGMPAGERNKKGEFPVNSVYYRIEKRLRAFTKHKRKKKSSKSSVL